MRPIKTFGRTKGRALSNHQSSLVNTRLDLLKLPENIENNFDPKSIMPDAKEVWFEIGFGGAEHMVNQALKNPDILIIGAEPYLDGVAKAISYIEEKNIKNIRIIHGDARPYLEKLKNNSLDRMFILFPDPWRKTKHHKRRIVNKEFAKEIVRLLKNKTGKLRMATDWANYAQTALFSLTNTDGLIWQAKNPNDFLPPPSDHFTTRYEVKGLGDCKPLFFDFIRE